MLHDKYCVHELSQLNKAVIFNHKPQRNDVDIKSYFRRIGKKEKKIFKAISQPPIQNNKDNPNLHIRDYLNHYLSLEHSPYYAALISGDWGVGKTFLVKSTLSELLNNTPYSYVSLYGTGNFDDIDAALYQSLHPVLAHSGVRILGRLGKAAMKYGRMDGAFKVGDFVGPSKDRLYVFDDLERSNVKPEQVLGYINELGEHDGCKVLIIANESKLFSSAGYVETREKLIGKTLEAQPAIKDALNDFLDQVTDPRAKEVMIAHSDILTQIFKQASARNFRVLQQTIWDFERLASHLHDRHYDNQEGIRTLISLFFSIALEVKTGTLTLPDIEKRPDYMARALLRGRSNEPMLPLDKAQKQFPEINLYDPILNNQVLVELLFKEGLK